MVQGTPGTSAPQGRFWLCRQCGRHVPARLTGCRCGFSRAGLGKVDFEPAAGPRPAADAGPSWFAVGPRKLIVMSVATLGLYQVYWFYQQWRRVRDGGEDVWPLPRSIFGVLYCYPLFKRMAQSSRDVDAPALEPGVLAVAYILLSVSWKLPSPFDLVSVLSVLPLAVAQRVASAAAARDFPQDDPNRRLTPANWMAVVVGGTLLALGGYAVVRREQPPSLEFLAKVADEANRAPRPPSEEVGLQKVVAQPGTLVYYYSVADSARPRLEERRKHLKEILAPSLCRDPLVKRGVSVRFVYTGAGGQELASVDISRRDCR